MPNQTAHQSSKCGNDKCGTFAPVPMHPHHGGKAMAGSGGSVTSSRGRFTPKSSTIPMPASKIHSTPHGGGMSTHRPMHGGAPIPMKGATRDSDNDMD